MSEELFAGLFAIWLVVFLMSFVLNVVSSAMVLSDRTCGEYKSDQKTFIITSIILGIILPPLLIPLYLMNKRRLRIIKAIRDKDILRFLEQELDDRFWMKEQEKREANIKHNPLRRIWNIHIKF